MDGFVTTQLLYVASELGVGRALADGPRTGAEVAEAVRCRRGRADAVLRGLALEDVVEERDGRFALTPLGEQLERMAGALRVRGAVYYDAAEGLLEAVREAARPSSGCTARPSSPTSTTSGRRGGLPGLDGRPLRAGGGRRRGRLRLQRVQQPRRRGRRARRAARGDPRRNAAARHPARPCRRGLRGARAPRRAGGVRGGRLLRPCPGGADAYLLSRVLHDWDDEPARRILPSSVRRCRRTAACSSSTRSSRSARRTCRRRSAWTCTCCCCSAPASAPSRSSAPALVGGYEVPRVVPTGSPRA